MDREERFPYEIVKKMAGLGLMGLPFPEEYGGAGADTVSYALAVMEISRADASSAITLAAHVSLGASPVLSLRHRRAETEISRAARARRDALGLRPDRARAPAPMPAARRPRPSCATAVGHQRHEGVHHELRHRHHRRHHDHGRDRHGARRPQRDHELHRAAGHARLHRARRSTRRWAGARRTRASSRSPMPTSPRRTCSARAARASSNS